MTPNFETSASAPLQLTPASEHRDGSHVQTLFFPHLLHKFFTEASRRKHVCNEGSAAFYQSLHQYEVFLHLWLIVLWIILPSEENVNWPQSLAHIKTYNFNPLTNIGQPWLFILTIAAVVYVSCENNRFAVFTKNRPLCTQPLLYKYLRYSLFCGLSCCSVNFLWK